MRSRPEKPVLPAGWCICWLNDGVRYLPVAYPTCDAAVWSLADLLKPMPADSPWRFALGVEERPEEREWETERSP